MDLYTIHGKQIFKNQEELDAHLQTDDVRSRFKSIIDPVSSYNAFLDRTKLAYILTLNFDNMSSVQSSIVENYLRSFSDGNTCSSVTDSQHFLNWNGLDGASTGNADMIKDILDHVDEDLAYMESRPMSRGQDLDTYTHFMSNICFEVFRRYYHKLSNVFPNFMSDMADSSLMVHKLDIERHIDEHVGKDSLAFIRTCDDSDGSSYWKSVMDSIKSFTSTSIELRKIYLLAFYPYYQFKFLMNSVAHKNVAEIQAPRLFLFQRFAVLSAYIYIFYTLMVILQSMGSSVTSANYQRAYLLLARFNDSIFSNESFIDQESREDIQAQVMANGTYKMSVDLKDVNQKIEDMKGNLGRSTFAEHRYARELKSKKIWSYFWIFVIIASLAVPLTLMLLSKDMPFFISWAVLLSVVFLGLIMNLVRK